MRGLPQKQNARRAYKIRLCGHLRRYKKIVKKTYIIYLNCDIGKPIVLKLGGNDHVKKTGEKEFFTEETLVMPARLRKFMPMHSFTLSKTEPTDLSGSMMRSLWGI